ncbi:SDR family oxidoreductase [Sinorhizobium sp. RAC02]|uniref:SDR family oxidoreductase n=1 Tax=Sinorhizobium sp. RAC02 TaxID=1842534 RepID=UPI00083DD42B|nr:SDR family oxidoreductase [Sinorhizobium sp. RAC02]AOF94076.1 3-beta hydroxysteroid dehydrogenase/isomerase family protein [Sinorhizobium sp. RAC02]
MAGTAIVTGATGGIGQAVTRQLTEKGFQVLALGTRRDALEQLSDACGCTGIAVDISDAEAVDAALVGVTADVLIHGAGLLGPNLPIHRTPAETIAQLIAVNVTGMFNILRAVVPGMVERQRGSIVLLGSICGNVAGAGPGAYSATKAAMQSVAANLRFDLQDTPIRVGEIRLGRVRTGIHGQLEMDTDFYDGYECILPDDVAQTILHMLATPPATDISTVEMMPTRQVVGGTRFSKG